MTSFLIVDSSITNLQQVVRMHKCLLSCCNFVDAGVTTSYDV